MSDNPDKWKVEPDTEEKRGCAQFFLIAALVVVAIVGALSTCSRCVSDYDDTWDRIDHSVKTDPYFDQW